MWNLELYSIFFDGLAHVDSNFMKMGQLAYQAGREW